MPYENIKLFPLTPTASAGGASGHCAYLKATYKIQSWGLDNDSPAITINLMPKGAGSIEKLDYETYKAKVVDSFKNFGYGPNVPKVEEVDVVKVEVIPTPPPDEPGN